MTQPMRRLPDFDDPPVVETVLGVQFSPLERFSIPHIGLYWTKIRSSYPQCETQAPLSPVVEEFGPRKPRTDATPGIEFAPEPPVRCWFMNPSSTRLLQLQKDRFIQNWRKVKGDEVYPRYETLRSSFPEEWQRFCRFLEEERLGTPDVNQCEVTYVNHIEIGRGWQSYGEIQRVVACWSGKYSGDFLPEPETVRLNISYLMPDKRGRLHIIMEPAIRRIDATEILQLRLTARGRPASSSVEDILDWFDTGHEWIVSGFTDFTTSEMHRIWRRRV